MIGKANLFRRGIGFGIENRRRIVCGKIFDFCGNILFGLQPNNRFFHFAITHHWAGLQKIILGRNDKRNKQKNKQNKMSHKNGFKS